MVKRTDQAEHDRLVKKAVDLLADKGCENIKADLPDFEKPKKIVWQSTGEGFLPDVTVSGDELRIFEIETADSIDDEHTAEEWKLFSSYAEVNDALFYVVFSKGSVEKVKKRIKELDVDVCLWEI
jgi:hypothetical protein